MNQTLIYLEPIDAQLFVEFQRNHALLEKLLPQLNVQYGKVIVNFSQGEVTHITKEEVVYKRSLTEDLKVVL